MAALAVLAECAPMYVLARMTGIAIGGELETGRRLRLVTGFADDLLVCSGQWKFRLARVIKTPACPAVRIVAIAATTSQPALMEILVASGARDRRVLVRRRPVAFFTGNRGMQPDQRKARQLVIERLGPSPIGIVVASLTPFAQFSLVRIVLAVTRHAGSRKLFPIDEAGVTGVAFDPGVAAPQRKLGPVVVEVHGLPLALIVTGFALGAIAIGVNVLQAVAGHAG